MNQDDENERLLAEIERLRDLLRSAIIDAKIAGREIVAPEVQEPPKVVNLMEALRRSLDTISATQKKPAQSKGPSAAKRASKSTTAVDGSATSSRMRASRNEGSIIGCGRPWVNSSSPMSMMVFSRLLPTWSSFRLPA